MREFNVRNGVYLTSDSSTSKLNNNILKCLIIVLLFNFCKYGLTNYTNTKDITIVFSTLLTYTIPIITSIITAITINKLIKKSNKLLTSANLIPIIILLIFINPSINTLILTILSIILTILTTINIKNIDVNLLAIILPSIWNIISKTNLTLDNPLYNLSKINYLGTYNEVMGKFGSILDYLIGNVYGNTSIILLVIILIYLYYKNQSKISIVISCLLSSFIMFSIIGIFNNMWYFYGIFNISIGDLLFILIFVSMDSKTSPILLNNQIIYGIIIAIFLVILRFVFPIYSVVLAVALSKLLVNSLDKLIYNKKLTNIIYVVLGLLQLIIPLTITYLL